jgi:DNA-binding NarL/FixJ family response regulator
MKKQLSKEDVLLPVGTISIGIVEDASGVRRNLQRLIEETPGFACLCACDCGEDALREIPRVRPDVVLMDLHLPNLSGIECTARLKELLPTLQVIILTVYDDAETIFNALRAGACGYLLKRTAPEKILAAITEVRQGGAPMTSEIARKLVETFQETPAQNATELNLTPREQEILELLSQGFANKEIAQRLSLSFDTIRWHLKQIYEKLHVRSRTEAAHKFRSDRDRSKAGPVSLPLPRRPV